MMKQENHVENNHLRLEISLIVTDEDIDDIMSAALDSRSLQDWCSEVNVVGGRYLGEYASDQISRGGELWFFDIEDKSYYSLDKEKFLNGLKTYIILYGDEYGFLHSGNGSFELDCGQIDDIVSDGIIQCALFDAIVYS